MIKTQILATKPTPNLSATYHLVAEDERQRMISTKKRNQPESAAFKAFQRREGSFIKERNYQKIVKDNRETKENETCTFCGRNGHKKEGCFKLVGYPEWWPGKKEKGKPKTATCAEPCPSPIPELTNEQYQMFVKHFSGTSNDEVKGRIANMAGKETYKVDLIIDSGCTEHITCFPDLLENEKRTFFESPVVIPNEESIPVNGKGDCTLPWGAKVNGVLCVPNFKCNLLFVSRISKDLQCAVTFFPDFCVMQGLQTRSLIGAGRCHGGLYRSGMIKERKAMVTVADTWYKRLGYTSNEKLSRIELVKDNFVVLSNKVCDLCAKAKLTRTFSN